MRSRDLVSGFCAAVVLTLLCACGEGTPSSGPARPPLPTPTPVGSEIPPMGTIYFGAYAAGGVAGLENLVGGRKFALDLHFYTWAGLFPSFQETIDLSNTRMPVDSWDCQPTNADIAAGLEDQLIVTRAQAIKAYGHPVFLRYMWDPNLPDSFVPPDLSGTNLTRAQCYSSSTDSPNGYFSPQQFVAAWDHIRAIFNQQGVTNVVWVWDVSNAPQAADPAPYYPGASEVDWVGIDAFDTTGGSFSDTVSAAYAQLAPLGKPILLAETGASQLIQPAFLQQVIPALETQFPDIKGFMYYDANAGSSQWVLAPAAYSNFITLANDPYMSAFGSL